MAKADLTAQQVRELFSYDPETGILTRLTRPAHRVQIGDAVGSLNDKGYLDLRIGVGLWRVHRVIWLHVTGQWPVGMIDHINGIKTDNRWSNLRVVTRAENGQNRRSARKGSRTGLLGVCLSKNGKTFRARIRSNGHETHIGTFSTAEAAHAAYIAAKRIIHPAGML